MASPYLGGGSSYSSPYLSSSGTTGRAPSRPRKKVKKKGASPFGFLGNLAGDVTDAVVGLGPAALATGEALAHDTASLLGRAPGSSGYAKKAARGGFRTDDVFLRPLFESYKYTYSPLVKGDIGEFLHRVYEHPLGPLLDAATFASFGVAGAAKLGIVPASVRRGTIELTAPGGKVVSKALPKQTLRAELQVGRTALLNQLPYETRYLGEGARAARQLRKGPHRVARSRELLEVPFLKVLSKVRNNKERAAAFWLSQVPLPDDLGRLASQLEEMGTDQALKTAAILRDEKFLDSYLNPSPKIQRVLDEASQVAEAQRAILGISDDVARQRAYMPMLLARGAQLERIEGERAFLPPPGGTEKVVRPRTVAEAQNRWEKVNAQVNDVLGALVEREYQLKKDAYDLRAGLEKRKPASGRQVPYDEIEYRDRRVDIQKAQAKAVPVEGESKGRRAPQSARESALDEVLSQLRASDDPTAVKFRALMDEEVELRKALEAEDVPGFLSEMYDEGYGSLGETTELRPAPGFGSIDEMIAKIDADLEAAGRPKPVYMPHTSERPKPSHVYGTGGVGPQQSPGPLRQTMGILLGRGQVIADPQVLRNSFVRSIKYALYRDIHQLHLDYGKRWPAEEPIPEGWQVIRRRHAEKTPYTVKTGSEFDRFAKEYLDKDAGFTFDNNPFVTKGEDAFTLVDQNQKYRIIVPSEFSRQLAGEFVRAGSFARFMNSYPLRVWRHLVLKLRPAWLVNNILGNTLLYMIENADPIALQEFARTFRNIVPKKQQGAFDELLRKHFPEQIHGTFIGSQLPVFGGTGKLAKMERVSSFVGAGLAQVDRAWEAGLRSSIVRSELRKSSELRQFAGTMRRQTDEFWKLADEELARNPLLAERISNKVNDALGDYLALGRVERDVIRSAFPFYAWYRVITLITLRLPFTHPLKAQLLARLGQAGAQTALEALGVPDENAITYAKGFFSLGEETPDGRVAGIATQSANPFATVAQLQESAIAFADIFLANKEPGRAWETLPGINPFIGIPIEVATGASSRSGSRAPVIQRFWESLPEVRLGRAILGQQYQGTPDSPTLVDRDTQDEIMRYLGIPYARVSPERIEEIGTGH